HPRSTDQPESPPLEDDEPSTVRIDPPSTPIGDEPGTVRIDPTDIPGRDEDEEPTADLSGEDQVPTADLDDDDIPTSDLTDQQVGETPSTAVFDPVAASGGPDPA